MHEDVDEVVTPSWPAPPWQLEGDAWFGWFTTRHGWRPPAGLTAVGRGRRILVGVFRFRGEIRYDEVTVASPVRDGWRIGMFARHVWVSTEQAAKAKKEVWGLDARVAPFIWTEAGVQVLTGTNSTVAIGLSTVRTDRGGFAPRVPAPGFTILSGVPSLIPSSVKARGGPGRIHVEEWQGESLPVLVDANGAFGMRARLVELVLPEPC